MLNITFEDSLDMSNNINSCNNGCTESPSVNFTWTASNETQSGVFCSKCAADWWNRFKNTEAGRTLIISPISNTGTT